MFFMFSITAVKSQNNHLLKDQIKSKNWDIISMVDFVSKGENELYPVYANQLKVKSGKIFDLKGYMVPIDNGITHQKFILSALPIQQCAYCGQNGIPILILIEMENAIDYSVKPIIVRGVLTLNKGNVLEKMPIVIKKAQLVK